MKIKKKLFNPTCLLFLVLLFSSFSFQTKEYKIDSFYERIEFKEKALDEKGNIIKHVYIETELENGVYSIEISDTNANLYNINGTNYYIKFWGFYGFAGFAEKGTLVVKTGFMNSKFIKK